MVTILEEYNDDFIGVNGEFCIWMVYKGKSYYENCKKLMIWGYTYFRTPPNNNALINHP